MHWSMIPISHTDIEGDMFYLRSLFLQMIISDLLGFLRCNLPAGGFRNLILHDDVFALQTQFGTFYEGEDYFTVNHPVISC